MSDEELRDRFRRDYTNEPIRSTPRPPAPTASPAPAYQQPEANKRETEIKPTKRRLKNFLGFIVILIIATTAGWFFIARQINPIPGNIRQKAEIPLYYPSKLPQGYSLSPSSYNLTRQVLTYYASDVNNNKILFTVEPRPSNFDFATFYSKGLSDSTQFTTNLGQAGIGKTQGRLLGSLPLDKSWILVTTSSSDIGVDDLRLVLQNLKKS